MAKKEIKRKNLKLRRRLRKTLGAVCLITALLIALIPVPETKAAGDKKYLWDEQIWKGSAAQSSRQTELRSIFIGSVSSFSIVKRGAKRAAQANI